MALRMVLLVSRALTGEWLLWCLILKECTALLRIPGSLRVGKKMVVGYAYSEMLANLLV